jgi:DNA-binding XRE family transcriptional regulator
MKITPEQCVAAREMLGWSRVELARVAGVGRTTLYTFERGAIPQSGWVLVVLRTALESAGIEFDDRDQDVRQGKGK